MVRILSLETSTTVCSVALHENETLVAIAEVHRGFSHGSKLAILIDDVMKSADRELKEIDAIAVSSGPGSYTGLRIGTSTAKGLCYALSLPLIAIGSLELLAAQVNKSNVANAWLCPMIDARRMEVYCLVMDAKGQLIQRVEARIIDEKSFEEHLDKTPVIFFGDGAQKCRPVLNHKNALFIEGVSPSATQLGSMAFEKYQRKEMEDVIHFEPFYLKEFRIKKPANLFEAVPNKIA